MDDNDLLEIKILVASDIHLGYGERDNIRKRDSFDSFEEVLQIADKNQVDMLLLGGDLFHENKPSRSTVFTCTELLRKYCMNDRPVTLEFVSDASVNFDHSNFPHVNYMDPNLNIGLPVFSINGNHDDLSGNGLSALDQLHAAGLLNYFGKYQNVEHLNVSPVLLRKRDEFGGETKLAMYGFGCIRDERLHRMFQTNKVTFLTFDDKNEQKTWFNLLVLHQNRVKHGPTNYIPEGVLPEFMDLVIWGHEHPCRIKPEETTLGFKIMQPGSTVATSLAEGEAGNKCVSLLRIKSNTMTDEIITLKTVRPFYFENIILSELNIPSGRVDTMKKIEKFCDERIKDYLAQAKEEHPDNPRKDKPLIRLRIDYSGGYDTFNKNRFGSKHVEHVANAKDIVLFHKKLERRESTNVDLKVLSTVMKQHAEELRTRVEDLVKEYFTKLPDKSQKLLLLTDNALGNAVMQFVDKDEKNAIEEMVTHQLARIQKKANAQIDGKRDQASVKNFLERMRDMRIENPGQADEEEEIVIRQAVAAAKRKRIQNETNGGNIQEDGNGNDLDEAMDEDLMVEELVPIASSTLDQSRGSRARGGRARGRGSRGGRGRGASADATTPEETPTRGKRGQRASSARGARGGAGRGSATKRAFDDGNDDVDAIPTTSGTRKSPRKRLALMRKDDDDVVNISEDDD